MTRLSQFMEIVSKDAITVGLKVAIVIGLILVVALIIAPTKTITNTVEVTYNDTETYYEKESYELQEPYESVETYTDTVSEPVNVPYQEIDHYYGHYDYSTYFNGANYVAPIGYYFTEVPTECNCNGYEYEVGGSQPIGYNFENKIVQPGPKCRQMYCPPKLKANYRVEMQQKTVQKERSVTKYRNVTKVQDVPKIREVMKTRIETSPMEVNWLIGFKTPYELHLPFISSASSTTIVDIPPTPIITIISTQPLARVTPTETQDTTCGEVVYCGLAPAGMDGFGYQPIKSDRCPELLDLRAHNDPKVINCIRNPYEASGDNAVVKLHCMQGVGTVEDCARYGIKLDRDNGNVIN